MSRVSVQVELFDRRSTSPACSAVKRCWPDSGTYFTFSESPNSAAETPRQMSTFMPVHLPWLSTTMKPAMPPTATPQTSCPRAFTASRSLPASASPAGRASAAPSAIAANIFFMERFLFLPAHSILAPTVFTTSAHFARSRFTVAWNCSIVS